MLTDTVLTYCPSYESIATETLIDMTRKLQPRWQTFITYTWCFIKRDPFLFFS